MIYIYIYIYIILIGIRYNFLYSLKTSIDNNIIVYKPEYNMYLKKEIKNH